MAHSPEEVRLGVEPEVDALEVDVELGDPSVGHADGDGQEVGVLAEVERRREHRRGPTQTLEEASLACTVPLPQRFRITAEVLLRGEEVPPHRYLHGDETLLVKRRESWEQDFEHALRPLLGKTRACVYLRGTQPFAVFRDDVNSMGFPGRGLRLNPFSPSCKTGKITKPLCASAISSIT